TMSKRSRFEICVDILMTLADGSRNSTRLMYATNLSSMALKACLTAMISKGFIHEYVDGDKRRLFSLTERGTELLHMYHGLMREVKPPSLSLEPFSTDNLR
ncbi:MAG: winged helix-turn-helix domain-containing protein, partial [Nitrososphaerales archaeon]